ncbi:PAS domain S-box protein [Halovivax gelatinilyticus]|uniref:PAS domain S-box protein n=1 Tax=Halovivax gelatinilyticus TaxID=2961597 RepID=UPI0020CA6ABC|nr:PAS domain S-box protein [Halovivax gelatinilyticus]
MSDSISVLHVAPAGTPALGIEGADSPFEVERCYSVAACRERLVGVDCVVVGSGFEDATPIDCCRLVSEHASGTPVVLCPADGSESLAGRSIAAGADGYVPLVEADDLLGERLLDALSADERRSPATGSRRDTATYSPTWSDMVVDQAPLAIIEWDLSYEAVRWNDAAEELFGYAASEVIGEPAIEIMVPPRDREAVLDHWKRLVETGESDRELGRNVRSDGSICVCEWHNSPIKDESGDVTGILSFAQEVTDEVRRSDTLEALQSTTHRLMRARSDEEIADIVVEAVTNVVDRARASVRLYDSTREALTLGAVSADVGPSVEGTTIGKGDGTLWDAFDRGESIVVESIDDVDLPYDLEVAIGTVICMPIGERGLLTIGSTADTSFGQVEYHLADVLAATAAVALERVDRDRELRRAKTIVETVGDGVYALDDAGRFTTVNDTLLSMTGCEREALLDAHASAVFPSDANERALAVVTGSASEFVAACDGADPRDTTLTTEILLETAGGETIPCEVTTKVADDAEAMGTVGIVRDVSDRAAMQQALLDHQTKITNLHEVVSRLEACETRADIYEETVEVAEGVLQFDLCVVSEVVDSVLELHTLSSGIDPDQFQTRRSLDEGLGGRTYTEGRTFRVNDVPGSAEAKPQDEGFKSGLSVPIGEYGVFQAISTEYDAFDERDEELAELLISHVVDALDRLAFEAQLVAERDRFAVLFENVPDAVVAGPHVGNEFIVEDMNSAFEETFGFDLETLEGEPIDEYITGPERRDEARAINSRSEAGEVIETEVKRRTTDGLRDFMLRVVPFEVEDGGKYAFGVYTDITEQKQRQKRVEVLNRVLRHDLRNGMNIIEGSAERLAALADDEEAEQYSKAISARTDELISLAAKTRVVERTLDRGALASGPVDAVDATEAAIGRVVDQYGSVDVDRSLPARAHVRADDLLTEAIYNVLENAVEHSDRDVPGISVSIEAAGADEPIAITIADDGPGIPDEERQLLEEEREITQLRHASGLGLWLVDWVVTQAGGELQFAENEPRGTIVELRLPASTAPFDDETSTSTVSE